MDFVGFSATYSYESIDKYIRILALAVSESARKNKIGFQLISSVEQFAKISGINKIVLTCGNREERNAAHIFYRKMDFQLQSTGYVRFLLSE